MNIVDENVLASQRSQLVKWRVPFRQIGFEIGKKCTCVVYCDTTHLIQKQNAWAKYCASLHQALLYGDAIAMKKYT